MKIIVTADSYKRLPHFMRPIMLRAAEHFTFDYSPEEWAKIAKSIESFEGKQEAIDEARVLLRNSARSYFLDVLNGPGHAREQKLRLQHWSKADRLSEALFSELNWVSRDELGNGPPNPDGAERKPYDAEMLALMKIRVMARSRVVHLSEKIDDGYPKATPKAHYQFYVLEMWTRLGGKLRFSRHPSSGKIKGPLVRYFSAVTEPVYGGKPESLPDIMKRHEARKAALEKWRLEMALAEAQP